MATGSVAKNRDEDARCRENERQQPNHPSAPNLKLQPRKKELWLPWPLGELRNDFYRFAAAHGGGDGGARRTDPLPGQRLLQRGREWAADARKRGAAALPFLAPASDGDREPGDGGAAAARSPAAPSSRSRYWVKDTTTSMATATAIPSLGKKKGKKHQKKAKPPKKHKGGSAKEKLSRRRGKEESGEERGGGTNQEFDKDVIVQYLKLQATVRLRQLWYGACRLPLCECIMDTPWTHCCALR